MVPPLFNSEKNCTVLKSTLTGASRNILHIWYMHHDFRYSAQGRIHMDRSAFSHRPKALCKTQYPATIPIIAFNVIIDPPTKS